ncbi:MULTISPECIES: hypothetical protein [unclassified Cupriavidus]|uniref:hypothetical protein n=1 Tax=unclassified Cupriavidus TaxID=2640874 RepID=UPI00040A24A3|nr:MULTISPECIES: hypothetical protein [unclassified Cupriavidus]
MESFVYQSAPSRVVFGEDALQHLPEEVARLGAHRALVLTTPEQRALGERLAGLLVNQALGIPASLAPIGMPEAGLDEAATPACTNAYYNPRPIEREAILALLGRASRGQAPA